MEQVKRNPNIELLRAISMLMIVAYHYSIYGFYAEDIIFVPNKVFVDIYGMCGKVGTDIFILISGYYMVSSSFSLKKLLKFMGQIWFYTLITLIVFGVLGHCREEGLYAVKISLFPLLTSHYWFASYYVLLMLFSPFINILLNSLEAKQHLQLLLLLFLLCTVMPELFGITFLGGSLPLFVALYVAGAYCRLHNQSSARISRICISIALAVLLICIAKICISDLMWQRNGNSSALLNSVAFMGSYSPWAFIGAFFLLAGTCKAKARQSTIISALGGTSFGVYLLHDNYFVRRVLWQDIFHTADFAASPYLALHALCAVGLIFAAGVSMDLIRQNLFAPLWDRFVVQPISSLAEKAMTQKEII